MKRKIIFASIFVFTTVIVACSNTQRTELPPTVNIKNTKLNLMKDNMEKQSSSFHHFLMGNMELSEQNFESALDNLKKAGELSEDNSATVHAKLAELYLREGLLEKALGEINIAIKEAPKKLDHYYIKAGLCEALSQSDEAKKAYKFIIQSDEKQKNAYLLLADIYREEGNIKKAQELLEEMILKFPDEIISYQYLARVYEKQKETEKAESILKQAYELEQDNDILAMEYCRVLILQSKLEEAKKVALKVIEEKPNHALARRILAELSLQDNNLDEALSHFNTLNETKEASVEVRYKIALIYMQKNMPEQAAKALNLLLASNPDHLGARYALGTVYVAQKKYEEAAIELEKVKFENDASNYVDAKLVLSYVLRKLNRDVESQKVLEEAYKNVPFDKRIAMTLIMVYRKLDKKSKTEDLILEYLEKNPGDIDMIFQYAILQYEMGKKDVALEKMKYVLTKNPEHAEALNYIAYSWAEDNINLDKAEEYAKRAIKKEPKNPYYLDTLGWVKYKKKKYKVALDLLLQALNLADDDIVILEHIGDAYLADGNETLAKRYYKQGLAKKSDNLGKEDQKSIKRMEKKLNNLK